MGALCCRNGTLNLLDVKKCLRIKEEKLKFSCFPVLWNSDRMTPSLPRGQVMHVKAWDFFSLLKPLTRTLTSLEQLIKFYQYLILKLRIYFPSSFQLSLILRTFWQGKHLTLSVCNLPPWAVSTWQIPSHLSRASSNVSCSVSRYYFTYSW